MTEKIRAVCSDIDGTQIISGNKIPTPAVQAAAQGLSVPLIEVTARNPERLLPFLNPAKGIDLLNLQDNPLVLDGGSTVMRANSGKVEWSQKVPRLTAWEAIKAIGHLCSDIQFNGIPKELRTGNVLAAIEAEEVLTDDIPSLFVVFPRLQEAAMGEALLTIEGIETPVFMDWDKDESQFCLQIGGTKRRGTPEALRILGLTEDDEVLKIGDGKNDIDLFLSWPGPNVAMGNAHPDVKAAADWIAPPVEEDGWAVAMHHYGLVD